MFKFVTMRNLCLIAAAILMSSILMISCGTESKSKHDDEDKTPQANCQGENEIAVFVSNYEYGMSVEDFVFDVPRFEVKQVEYKYENDSNASVKLMNYAEEEIEQGRLDSYVDINIDIRAKDGAKLGAGEYKYNDYDSSLWSRVTLRTSAGIVWFNWVMGMPHQGYVQIKHICPDEVCGTLNLNVEKPEDEHIGIVKVNGTFSFSTVEE
jgi:hypothetical protein